MRMIEILRDIWGTAKTVLPLAMILVILQVIVLKKPIKNLREFIIGILLSIAGLHFFLKGVFMSILPLGDSVGGNIAILDNKLLIVAISLVIGYLGTLVEPALKTLALEVEEVSVGAIPNKVLIHAVAIGFGLGMGIGVWKIINNISFIKIVIPLIFVIILLIPFVPKEFVSIAMDSASATTGPVNIPLNMAIAVGLAKSLENVDPLTSGFGIIGLTSIGAVISVMVLGLLTRI
ncbi:MAG TPA: DUF1538 domain-containing protein [Rectinema sp.]|jgi:hypothetical protein|nr:DUF1538 domain-containing protein [Spirochaetia bacterium]NLH88918.1 DUF1538 domain-containing protein [Treponema sp.]HNP92812.1 DUF1538 domain-containing protein [Rectinema sp.]HNT59709.1 DUF1538 domain-containing protein [Rectinema sp.]HOH17113.1 DUF1538 domain-containing protein [Rectinema sp.]